MNKFHHRFISKSPKSAVVIITPKEAAFYLKNYNNRNRDIRPAHVASLAKDMELGYFQCNGATIVFNTEGGINDGQHRLSAVVKSNKPLATYVSYGVSLASQLTTDQHAKRKLSDCVRLENGELIDDFHGSIIKFLASKANNWSQKLSTSQEQPYVNKYINIIQTLLNQVPGLHKRKWLLGVKSRGFRRSIVAAIVEYYEKDSAKALEFANLLADEDVRFDVGSPIKLFFSRYTPSGGGTQKNKSDYFAMLWVIHKFHYNMRVGTNLCSQEKWEF